MASTILKLNSKLLERVLGESGCLSFVSRRLQEGACSCSILGRNRGDHDIRVERDRWIVRLPYMSEKMENGLFENLPRSPLVVSCCS